MVRDHPRKLIEMVMVTVDRCITRRETAEGRKLTVLDSHSKVRHNSKFWCLQKAEHGAPVACILCSLRLRCTGRAVVSCAACL